MHRPSSLNHTRRKGIPKRVPSLTQNVVSYVTEHRGHKPITSILVANNGLGAVKFIRSVRMWSVRTFGSDKAILMVAMATPEDIRINAEHLQLADQFVEVPGGTNNNNYANVRLILQTAKRAQVDAVWPGWGHASEDPQLPTALKETGIIFLGPPAEAMAALGDKVGSTILAQAAGVPTYPWSGTGVKISFQECNGVIPSDVYEQACLQPESATNCCQKIGYPVMLKASWGGGGKGIRTAHSKDEVESVLKQVQGEVPGSPIFAMKLASRCRHLEVQLLCDQHGNVCSLYSRDCSLQRRHQKIVEEGPVLGVDSKLLIEMEKCARALARSVGYVGAATVEYLYSIPEGKYYFLELNPRLQVEHPVTEGITSVNLPSCQVMIGMGIPLHCIPEIRLLYGEDPKSHEKIDFEKQERIPPDGHVLAVRITSENANDGFKPTSGRIDDLHFRPTSEVWGYFSVKSGGGIHEFSDSQFGHLFAKGGSRQEAIRAMVVALKEVKIRGEIRTTVDYIINMIQEADFEHQRIHTAWLDNRIAQQITSERPPWTIALVSGSIVKALEKFSSRSADYLDLLHKGQIPPSSLSLTQMEEELVLDGMKYSVRVKKQGLAYYQVELNGSSVECVARLQADGGILLQLDGVKHVVYSEKEPMGIRLSIDSWTCLLANESDPTQVLAPSAGKIRRYLVEDGARVLPDQGYAELEVMKMLMPLLAPAAGRVYFQLPEGAILSCGDLIARLELDDLDAIHRAVPSQEKFPDTMGPPLVLSDRVDDRFALVLEAAGDIFSGYERNVDQTISELLVCLDDKDLASLRWSERFSVAQNRLPGEIKEKLEEIMKQYDNSSFDIVPEVAGSEFPSLQLIQYMESVLEETSEEQQATLEATLGPLLDLAREHEGGKEGYARKITQDLLEKYLEVEEKFQPKGDLSTEQDVIYALRQEYNEDLQEVLALVVSHQGLKRKAEFVKQLLLHLVLPSPTEYRPILRRLTSLASPTTQQILIRAQYLLEHSLLADLRAVVARSLSGLDMFSGTRTRSGANSALQSTVGAAGGVVRKATHREGLYEGLGNVFTSQLARSQVEAQKMNMLVEAPAAVEDALALLLDQLDETYSEQTNRMGQLSVHGMEARVLITYIKRIYHHQLIQDPKLFAEQHFTLAQWTYQAHLDVSGVECDGAMILLSSLSYLKQAISELEKKIEKEGVTGSVGTLHVAVTSDSEEAFKLFPEAEMVLKKGEFEEEIFCDLFDQDDRVTESLIALDPKQVSLSIQSSMQALQAQLSSLQFTTIGFMIKTRKIPLRKGYIWSETKHKYLPQVTLRCLEPSISHGLELSKLEHLTPRYSPSRNRQWHSFTIDEKMGRRQSLKRLYLRGLIHQIGGTPAFLAATYSESEADIATAVINEVEETLTGCLQELLRLKNNVDTSGLGMIDWAHIFLSLLPPINFQTKPNERSESRLVCALRSACAAVISRQISSLRHAAVAQVELRLPVESSQSAWRVILSVPTGHETGEEHIDIYQEQKTINGYVYQKMSGKEEDDLDGKCILEPYSSLSLLQQKQLTAKRHSTTYCYDFPKVFTNALQEIWSARASAGEPGSIPPPGQLVESQELGFESMPSNHSPYEWSLEFVETPVGRNEIGMVAWLMTLKTPECPQGRQVITIANDITHQSGAFGPKEDALFKSAVDYALHEKLPVLYLAANSGARVGLAVDIREKLKVQWNREADPSKGIQALYLEEEDYYELVSKGVEGSDCLPVLAEKKELSDGKIVWVLSDVIGCEDGLGVECLSGSGAIAGAFSKAYKEGFTITLVSGRSVGIGAYLARLGRRCIQSNQPIILTGYQALNKLLGREVYTSQLQLGGPRIMGVNGVSHHIVQDDLNGIKLILKWLAYTPPIIGATPNLSPTSDPADRLLTYHPEENQKLDPRKAILDLLDKGSWLEAQEGWAKTVVTGRGRLGGMPIGVIAVQTETMFKTIPADPGMLESSEQTIPQAGQVWFPDSATKTAQAMEEFDREGLPLMILANWRGFSGGQRDLFEGVLQAGSLIVDHLRAFRRPVFVYLPPGCELRGGAWVVIDSKINCESVEMYADQTARGGVLEPEGVVEIKFKRADLMRMMKRLDPEIQRLHRLGAAQKEIKKREDFLMPVYHQIALQFAEMHDTPQRMLAKGIIKGIVSWKDARSFFIKRLRRRLMEEALVKHIATADPSISRSEATKLLQDWFLSSAPPYGDISLWKDDVVVQQWAESSSGSSRIALELKTIKSLAVQRHVQHILASTEGKEGTLKALEAAIKSDPHFKKHLNSILTD